VCPITQALALKPADFYKIRYKRQAMKSDPKQVFLYSVTKHGSHSNFGGWSGTELHSGQLNIFIVTHV
jgi:hypothetical protein